MPWITFAKFAVNYVLVALLLCIGVFVSWRWFRPALKSLGPSPEDRVDTVLGWHPSVVRVMTAAEQSAFDIVRAAFPECIVLSQVPLSRFIKVSRHHSYTEWLRRVGNQCADILVCNSASKVLAAIEVRCSSVDGDSRAMRRSARTAETLRAAGLAFHVWPDTALPSVEQARQLLGRSGHITDLETDLVGSVPRLDWPAKPWPDPIHHSNSSLIDEASQARDGPPSSWFDELDIELPLVQGKTRPAGSSKSVQ